MSARQLVQAMLPSGNFESWSDEEVVAHVMWLLKRSKPMKAELLAGPN